MTDIEMDLIMAKAEIAALKAGNMFTVPDDYVKVVRCGHCESFGIYPCSGNGYCKHPDGLAYPVPDGFCNYGELKDGDNEGGENDGK